MGDELTPNEMLTTADARHSWYRGLVKSHPEWTVCKRCGVVQRADGGNGPCRGEVRVTLRDRGPVDG